LHLNFSFVELYKNTAKNKPNKNKTIKKSVIAQTMEDEIDFRSSF